MKIPTAYKLDVAIVGAGASGIYSAFRLSEKAHSSPAFEVFEMSDRIGGRIFSKKLKGMDYHSELGGMRYITSQRLVTSLIEGDRSPIGSILHPIPFPMGTDGSRLINYLRGVRTLQSDTVTPQRYGLKDGDLHLSADQLFNKVIYTVLRKSTWFMSTYPNSISVPSPGDYQINLNAQQWLDVKTHLTYDFEGSPYYGIRANDLGFWNLIKDLVGEEGYNFLADGGGYYSNTINWNSAEAFEYMVGDFAPNVEYKTLKDGFNKLLLNLAKHVDPTIEIGDDGIAYNSGKCFKINHQLIALARVHQSQVDEYLENYDIHGRRLQDPYATPYPNSATGEDVYVLTFKKIEASGQIESYVRVIANKVILAMPRRSIELLMNQGGSFFTDTKENEEGINFDTAYRSVIKEPAYKLLMVFDKPWWQAQGICTGHSITDLPVRQCYYFATNESFNSAHHQAPGDGNAPSNAVMLSSYGDMNSESFWKALSDFPERIEGASFRYESASSHYEMINTNGAFAQEILHQLKEIHGLDAIPNPTAVYFKDWTDDPYGAGYHAWKASANVPATREYLRNVFKDDTFHVVGEAYSTQQGWVEGAFFEAERVMKDSFNLEAPIWFSKNTDGTLHDSYERYMYPERKLRC